MTSVVVGETPPISNHYKLYLPHKNNSSSSKNSKNQNNFYKTSENSSLSNMSEYKPKNNSHSNRTTTNTATVSSTSQEDVKIEINHDRISTHSEKVASSLRCCSSSNNLENNTNINNSSTSYQNNADNNSSKPPPNLNNFSPAPPVLKLGVQNKHSLTVPNSHQTSQFQANNSDENNTTTTSTPRTKEKKLGHRRVDTKTGLVTYKRQPHDLLGCAMQLGIVTTLSNNKQNANESNRDILIEDFQRVEKLNFTEDGSDLMPAHEYGDFQFKIYAPNAFRYFRQLFGIKEDDFLASIGEPKNSALISMSNPGASGSLFWRTHDDEFIIKTVQKDEAKFLRDLLPGYYMNLNQNPRSLLPKFYGLYLIKTSNHKNIRLMVMNNLIPTSVPIHLKYDLKGSTLGRNASERELQKSCPVLKDNDWTSKMPDGIYLDHDIYRENGKFRKNINFHENFHFEMHPTCPYPFLIFPVRTHFCERWNATVEYFIRSR